MTAINYAQYGQAGTDPNGGGPCTPISGSITFMQSPGNTLTTILAQGSRVCETGPAGAPHHVYLVLTITGGTGKFHGATGTINSNGISTDASATMHNDTATLTGSITLEHGRGHDCGNDGNGNCGDDHGDGHGND